jgi:hypothetical protein
VYILLRRLSLHGDRIVIILSLSLTIRGHDG